MVNMMKAFIVNSKSLEEGIRSIEVQPSLFPELVSDIKDQCKLYEKKNLYFSEEEALSRVEELRGLKIIALEKEIRKIKELKVKFIAKL